jgi:hypothetical protein
VAGRHSHKACVPLIKSLKLLFRFMQCLCLNTGPVVKSCDEFFLPVSVARSGGQSVSVLLFYVRHMAFYTSSVLRVWLPGVD